MPAVASLSRPPGRCSCAAAAVRRRDVLLAAAAASCGVPAHAQAWPSRPIRIVVPFPPGSAADAVPRGIAQHLQGALGVPCFVDNRPGAAGAIGADLVAKAPPDGYTLLSHTSSLTIQPHLGPVPFDVLRDLAPVSQTVSGSYVLVVHPSFPASDLRQFIAVVRAAPGRYSYGSHGSGSGPHLAMELLKSDARIFALHVPFRGAAASLQELVAGRLDMAFDTSFAVVPLIAAGRLKAIAVGGLRPVGPLPGVRRIADLYRGFDTDGWQGLFAPAGVPPAVVQQLSALSAQALQAPPLAEKIAGLGFRPLGTAPDAFARVVRADHAKYGRIIRERRIRAD